MKYVTAAVVFMNIHQTLSKVASTLDNPTDFKRNLCVSVARNSGKDISHITFEFSGPRAKFLGMLAFDGSGDCGTGIRHFSMPGLALTHQQKAIVILSIIEYLIQTGDVKATLEYFTERLAIEVDGGTGNLAARYDRVRDNSFKYIASFESGAGTKSHPRLLSSEEV